MNFFSNGTLTRAIAWFPLAWGWMTGMSQPVSPEWHDQNQLRTYACYWTDEAIEVDGLLNEAAWSSAQWTDDFVDIEGNLQPLPLQRTRAKMLWDEHYFYIAARMDETDIWATYDTRDAVIFHENDFEVFIDPDGDTHHYYELEINALGTVWDLMLTKPYRDGGRAIDAWDIAGLKKGIQVQGTLNDPSDRDQYWTVELALPWTVLMEAAPRGKRPGDGDEWKVNFSRVNWQIEGKEGVYIKKTNPETGKLFPEYNWVWSPQGVINMHQPETWGRVRFRMPETNFPAIDLTNEEIHRVLRRLYFKQRSIFREEGLYLTNLEELVGGHDLGGLSLEDLRLFHTRSLYEIVYQPEGGGFVYHITQDGRFWKTENKVR